MKEKDSKWDGFGKIEYNFFETVKYAQNQAVIYKHKKRNCSSDAFFACKFGRKRLSCEYESELQNLVLSAAHAKAA